MVDSIELILDVPVPGKELHDLINSRYDIEPYNNGERESVERGFTLKDKNKIEEMCRIVIDDFERPLECDCDFCKKIGTKGNLIVTMFGFTLHSSYWQEPGKYTIKETIYALMEENYYPECCYSIGRSIWWNNWMLFIQNDRLSLLYYFLADLHDYLLENGIKTTFDNSDVNDDILIKVNEKIPEYRKKKFKYSCNLTIKNKNLDRK